MPKGEPNRITEVTRRSIVDALLLDREPFYGRLDLVGFLRRVWPLKDMPSTDRRFEDAEGDIWQHIVNNEDWTTDELFYNRLDVLDMPDERFAKFLEESVHPLVSTGPERTARLVSQFNGYLSADGFALRPDGQISGHKLYKLVSTTGGGALPEAYEVSGGVQPSSKVGLPLGIHAYLRFSPSPNAAGRRASLCVLPPLNPL